MSETERYNGLTTADTGALLDAKARGAAWVAREKNGALWGYKAKPKKVTVYETRYETWSMDGSVLGGIVDIEDSTLRFIQWSDTKPVNIDLALAQIAKMESKQNNALSEKANEKGCLTMNERINQMTVDEKAKLFDSFGFCVGGFVTDEECNANKNHYNCAVKWLNSPYTEGDTDEG